MANGPTSSPRSLRCYIAGPMRGIPYFNHPAFQEAAESLRAEGWEVVSPHEKDIELGLEIPADGATSKALRDFPIGDDLKAVAESDAVFVLPGWERSEGAKLEVDVANRLGVQVIAYETRTIVRATTLEVLPSNSAARKAIPLVTGVLDYFPAALAAVAQVSKAGNDKHNPGEPLHWARGKSTDQADAIGRHLLERGSIDPDTGMRHSAQLAWRALALLQIELEEAGEAPLARGASE